MKKAINRAHKKYKDTFTRTDGVNEPEDHHIATVIFLLMFIIIFLTAIVFLLLQEDKKKTELIQELVIQNQNDFSSYKYSLIEFSQISGFSVGGAQGVKKFLLNKEYEEVSEIDGKIVGRKGIGCNDDVFSGGQICRTSYVSHQIGSEFVEVGIERKVLTP